jgi:hypothetical protein
MAVPGQTLSQINSTQLPLVQPLWSQGGSVGLFFDGGTNDIPLLAAGTETEAQFQALVQSTVSGLTAAGVPAANICLSGVAPLAQNEPDFTISQFIDATWSAAATAAGMGYVSLINLFTNGGMTFDTINQSYYYSDGVHYSAAGWAVLYPAIRGIIQAWQAL